MGKVWVAPQGWAAPQAAVQSELNAVPEMQHWPGGNDMPRELHARRLRNATRVSARFCAGVMAAQGDCFTVARFVRRLDRETANTPAKLVGRPAGRRSVPHLRARFPCLLAWSSSEHVQKSAE